MFKKKVEFLIDGQVSFKGSGATGVGAYKREYDGTTQGFAEQYLDVKKTHYRGLIETLEKELVCKIDSNDVRIDYMVLVRYWED